MLVLTRRIGERIVIDNRIVLEVVQVQGQRIRLGITAPPEVSVLRAELIRADAVVNGPASPPAAPPAV